MSQFQVEIRGVEELRRKLDQVLDPVGPRVKALVHFVEGRAREGAKPHPADKGTLGATVKSELAPSGTSLSSVAKVVTRSGIARTVEEGRAPGRPPPLRALERWATSHGVHTRVWELAQQIRRTGTKGVGFMKKAAGAGQAEAQRTVGQLAREIERRWGR